jgi:hypothetical protein
MADDEQQPTGSTVEVSSATNPAQPDETIELGPQVKLTLSSSGLLVLGKTKLCSGVCRQNC